MATKKRVAVILCGSGYKDGSEIRESVAALWALSSLGAEVQCFAPVGLQVDVINCLSGEPMPGEKREMRIEAARIARGDVLPLSTLNPSEFDALILPGGFGVAKNLCTFAFQGSKGSVHPELLPRLESFFRMRKPIGAICIAPAVLALAFPGKGFELTLGEPGEAAREIEKLGHTHRACGPSSSVVDPRNRIVTTPAYMLDQAPLHEIFEGIRSLCSEVLKLAE